MTRMSIGLSVATAIALASGNAMSAAGAELSLEENGPATRHEDPVGDATGDAPDIVACTISEPDDGPVVAISVEFASEPPLETDMETYTDVVFIGLVTDPEATPTLEAQGEGKDEASADETDNIFGAHAVTLPEYLESGAHLYVAEGTSDLFWHVDVAVDGPLVTWTLDRKLIGDPDMLSWHVLAGVEREETADGESDDESDECPDDSRGTYTLKKAWR